MDSDDRDTGGIPESSPRVTGASLKRFVSDLYWLVIITLIAVSAGLWLLPPRASETVELLRREQRALRDVERLQKREQTLIAAIRAIQDDPIYRAGAYRKVLKVKRKSEEYAEPRPTSFPINRP